MTSEKSSTVNEFTPAELRALERAGNAARERTRRFIRAEHEHQAALMGTPKPLTRAQRIRRVLRGKGER